MHMACVTAALTDRLHVVRCMLHVVRCMLSAACCMLSAACCMLSAACCPLHIACCKLRMFPAAGLEGCPLHFARCACCPLWVARDPLYAVPDNVHAASATAPHVPPAACEIRLQLHARARGGKHCRARTRSLMWWLKRPRPAPSLRATFRVGNNLARKGRKDRTQRQRSQQSVSSAARCTLYVACCTGGGGCDERCCAIGVAAVDDRHCRCAARHVADLSICARVCARVCVRVCVRARDCVRARSSRDATWSMLPVAAARCSGDPPAERPGTAAKTSSIRAESTTPACNITRYRMLQRSRQSNILG